MKNFKHKEGIEYKSGLFIKAIVTADILKDRGSISKETYQQVEAYLMTDGDPEKIRHVYEIKGPSSKGAKPYFDLLHRQHIFEETENMIQNRIVPFAEKHSLIELCFGAKKLLARKKGTAERRAN